MLRLAGLPPGHSEYRGHLDFVSRDAAGEDEAYALDVRVDVDNLGSRLLLRGAVQGEPESACHRCLTRFQRPVTASFEVTLQKGVTAADAEDIVAVPENAVEYDMAPHVREAVILEEPIRLVCRPDCRGLC